ncbi:MAG: urease accessory protein UreE [Burkholderiaceae bacterium]|nr:urease accessory protein UreE [Burkholderiaceae bacterium]
MIQVSKLIPQGHGLAPVLLKRATTVELDWEVRQKSRFAATDSAGRELGVFLPRGTLVRGGDVLVAEDGSLVRVLAAPQAVLVITHCKNHGTPFDLTRAAYHLGNRHVPIELQPDHLKIEPDHVLADMLRAMHLIVTAKNAPFEPEGGAYAAGHGGGHHHGGHGHSHDHDHAHSTEHEHSDGHSHGDGDGHRHAGDHADEHAHTHGAQGQPDTNAPNVTSVRGRTLSIPVVAQGHVHGPHCNHDH